MIVYFKLGDEDSDVGHIKCSLGPHLAHGPQVPHPCSDALLSPGLWGGAK